MRQKGKYKCGKPNGTDSELSYSPPRTTTSGVCKGGPTVSVSGKRDGAGVGGGWNR